jgi:hypothetical protein
LQSLDAGICDHFQETAIHGRGHDHYRELGEQDFGRVLADFQAIGTDSEKFNAFVNAAESRQSSAKRS